MTEPGTLASWLRLTLVPGIGGGTQRKLLTAFGLPDVIFSAGYASLRALIGDEPHTPFDQAVRQALVDLGLVSTRSIRAALA